MADDIKEKVIQHIEKEWDRVEFGDITIEKNANSGHVDVVIRERKRFLSKEKERKVKENNKPRQFREG